MRVKTSCPTCGEVEIDGAIICLVTYVQRPFLNYYAFTCETCQERVQKRAEPDVVLALKEHVDWRPVEIPDEALEEHKGGPITNDEILDWMNEVLKYL